MKQKRLIKTVFLLFAALSLLVWRVSADDGLHREHTSCAAIRTQEELLRMETGGSYYLENDITLSETVTVNGEVTLCLNGKLLQYGGAQGSVFLVGKEGSLRICDCSEQSRFFREQDNGLWTLSADGEGKELKGGAILGGKGKRSEIEELESEYVCGGFAYVDGGSLFLEGGNIVGNLADYGGAVYVTDDGYFGMKDGKLCGNLATARGGGVFVRSGEVLLENGAVSDNRAEKNGGGIDISGESIFVMRGGFVTENTAGAWSGGIENFGRFDMYGGTVSANSAQEDGGGVYNGGSFSMHGGTVRENSAKYGGGVCNDGKMTLHGGKLLFNLAKESGGGIYNADTLVINEGTVASNTAVTSGGGIENDGAFTMYGGTVGGSDAEDANMAYLGGGICVYGGSFTMYGGSVERNTGVDGGGVENEALFSMHGGRIAYNYAALQGGGVTNRGALILAGSAAVVSNASGSGENEHAGGGIYWITGEKSTVSVSGEVSVTKNTTSGADANLVIFGEGTVRVSDVLDTARIGLTLLDQNKKADSGKVLCFENAETAENTLACFAADVEGFALRLKDGEAALVKKDASLALFLAFLSLAALGAALCVFICLKRRRKSRDFKK